MKEQNLFNKQVHGIDWIIKYCSGNFQEIFYELRTEIEIQKMGYLFDFQIFNMFSLHSNLVFAHFYSKLVLCTL